MKNSYWIQNAKSLDLPSLQADTHVDVVIVGGGMVGIMLAHYLMATQKNFILVEADEIGHGATGRNTGKVTSQHSAIYHTLYDKQGEQVAKQYYEANEEAIASIASLVEQYHIDCDFTRVNSIVYTAYKQNETLIQKEYEVCQKLGIPCSLIDNEHFPFSFAKGIQFQNQAQFNPLLFLQGIAKEIIKQGYTLYEHTPIKEIAKEDNRYILYAKTHKIYAKTVILATQFPFIDEAQLYFSKLFNEQSSLYYSQSNIEMDDQLISCDEIIHTYRRLSGDENYLLFGGEHHRVGEKNKEDNFVNLHKELFQLNKEISGWTSQDYYTSDHLPLVGPLKANDNSLLFASGLQKWGNTLGVVAAKLLCAQIIEKESIYTNLFDPHRSGLILSMTSIVENTKTALNLLLGKLSESDDSLPNTNQASVVMLDGKRYGVYCDKDSYYHVLSITCPHMGCTLTFNEQDTTWDCPCHGSRFDIEGQIIKGPASTCLQQIGKTNKINPHLHIKKTHK